MPNRRVSKSEFKAKASEFFRLVESSGESLIVTDLGQPTLELRPYQTDARDPLDLLRGSLLRYDNPMDPAGEDDWAAAW
ncbi:type II toxin-antitoxin system Phd/YefM family antitoxin [Caballeronia sp. LjRoot31]|uniref:type II toxin-antitoxin system Phd/YefM family antitoxin n=1 Tax=Caballeronia sp. LjRoot31 TaxID=3342324 RepID=UPI003ECF7216